MGANLITFGELHINSEFFVIMNVNRRREHRSVIHPSLKGTVIQPIAHEPTRYSFSVDYIPFGIENKITHKHWHSELSKWEAVEGTKNILSIGGTVLADNSLGLAYFQSIDYDWDKILYSQIGVGFLPRVIHITMEFVTPAQKILDRTPNVPIVARTYYDFFPGSVQDEFV